MPNQHKLKIPWLLPWNTHIYTRVCVHAQKQKIDTSLTRELKAFEKVSANKDTKTTLQELFRNIQSDNYPTSPWVLTGMKWQKWETAQVFNIAQGRGGLPLDANTKQCTKKKNHRFCLKSNYFTIMKAIWYKETSQPLFHTIITILVL